MLHYGSYSGAINGTHLSFKVVFQLKGGKPEVVGILGKGDVTPVSIATKAKEWNVDETALARAASQAASKSAQTIFR